jgi:hypothetical protein
MKKIYTKLVLCRDAGDVTHHDGMNTGWRRHGPESQQHGRGVLTAAQAWGGGGGGRVEPRGKAALSRHVGKRGVAVSMGSCAFGYFCGHALVGQPWACVVSGPLVPRPSLLCH